MNKELEVENPLQLIYYFIYLDYRRLASQDAMRLGMGGGLLSSNLMRFILHYVI